MEQKLKVIIYNNVSDVTKGKLMKLEEKMGVDFEISPISQSNDVYGEIYQNDILLIQFFSEEALLLIGNIFGINLLFSEENNSDAITPLAWYDGCAPGGYKHCGSNCGDEGKYGGGTPINATDTCCRGHDRCWSKFGKNDACCDKELLNCMARAGDGPIVKAIADAWFGGNAKKCK